MFQTENLEEGLREILQTVLTLTDSKKGYISLCDPETGKPSTRLSIGVDDKLLSCFSEHLILSGSQLQRAIDQKKQIIFKDITTTCSGDLLALASANELKSAQTTPFFRTNGELLGLISIFSSRKGEPDLFILTSLELYVRLAEKFIERTLAFQEIESQNIQLDEKIKERTAELITLLNKEKQTNEQKSRFVSMASHEFRTPLTAILSSLYLLEKQADPELPPRQKKQVDRMTASAKHLVRLLDDFL